MGKISKIEWTDATWSPIRVRVRPDAARIAEENGYASLVQIAERTAGRVGQHCEKVSAECEHCYAESHNRRCLPADGTGLPYDRRSRDLVESFVDPKMLAMPLKWAEPKRIFVENRSDLFGEWVADDLVDQVFAVMALCPHHVFQVLTKRAERANAYMNNRPGFTRAMCWAEDAMKIANVVWRCPDQTPERYFFGVEKSDKHEVRDFPTRSGILPNVWLGVTVGNQEQANKRIPHLLDTPAALRYLSVEPMLGPVDLSRISGGNWDEDVRANVLTGEWSTSARDDEPRKGARIDWVVCGGESGHGARPMHPDWVRSLRDQCLASGVPFFFKQWGEWGVPATLDQDSDHGDRGLFDGQPSRIVASRGRDARAQGWCRAVPIRSKNGLIKIGKNKAGRLLDGHEHNDVPAWFAEVPNVEGEIGCPTK